MSARIHQLLTRDHPDKHIPVPMHSRPRCQNPACHAVVPEGATFCPRCGERFIPSSGTSGEVSG